MAVPATKIVKPGSTTSTPTTLRLATSRGKKAHPLWVTLYASEGLGKSTFGSRAPAPIFIDVERGTFELDVERFVFDESGRTTPETFTEILLALRALEHEEHGFQTVVIDTLDAVEALLHAHICQRDSKTSIEDYGYGKGYVAALDEWRILIAQFERLRRRGINVLTLAHAMVKTFKDPASEGWDRYQMKLHQAAAGLIKERSDIVLFGKYEEQLVKSEKTKRVRGVSTGARIIHTVHSAAWDAKNRHDLPETMPLDWDDFYAAVQAHRPADPELLATAIREMAAALGGEVQAKALANLERNTGNAAVLAKIINRLNVLMAEKAEEN